ncbi:MAG TPA: NusG domain II-containing protein [Mollicutes bacterium]|nr:NusG domain II-containing protein [Mollicutes bacterium]
MNKHDFILISIIFIISVIFFGVTFIVKNDNANVAYVYYENKLIKIIDLSNDELKEYTIKGYNGDVIIETKRNQIRVKEETSPLNLCSKQGWVTSSLETIVCLPNKVIIKIGSSKEEIDAVVR